MLFTKTKPASHGSRILSHLKQAGSYGEYNHVLARQGIGGLDWRRAISTLRKDGHNIQCVRLSKGLFKYYLND